MLGGCGGMREGGEVEMLLVGRKVVRGEMEGLDVLELMDLMRDMLKVWRVLVERVSFLRVFGMVKGRLAGYLLTVLIIVL
jgi:hypothetical protein